ncbi:MAG TPA: ABC transporter substrate-binding protein [Xanthobacteraceae bacterium]|nr:ABC transporter substrate-binding protein [Xanthobacteraceae bacterium]
MSRKSRAVERIGRAQPRHWGRRRLAAWAMAAGLAAAGHAAHAQEKLTVAVGGRGIGESCLTEIGKDAGIFARHGLDLNIVYTDGSGETQQAVVSNSAQIGVTSGMLGAMSLYAKGAPVRVIGASYSGGSQIYWFVPAGSAVKTPRDLDGKTVGYSTYSSASHVGLLALQKHYNLNFKLTQTGSAAATLTATMSQQLDAGWAGAPFAIDQLEAGKIRLVMKASDSPDVDKQTVRVIIANADALKAKRDLFARYLAGYRETLDWIFSTPEGFRAYAAFSSLSEPLARRALSEFLPRRALEPDRITGLDEAMADAVTFKFLSAPLTREQIADLIQLPGK